MKDLLINFNHDYLIYDGEQLGFSPFYENLVYFEVEDAEYYDFDWLFEDGVVTIDAETPNKECYSLIESLDFECEETGEELETYIYVSDDDKTLLFVANNTKTGQYIVLKTKNTENA